MTAPAVARPAEVELVLTGRDAPAALMERADLVTEMREVKHHYRAGVRSRLGIEHQKGGAGMDLIAELEARPLLLDATWMGRGFVTKR